MWRMSAGREFQIDGPTTEKCPFTELGDSRWNIVIRSFVNRAPVLQERL